MPRVARRKDAGTANSPLRSPKSIPLNDDQHEKAARFQSRQALQELQLNQIRAAASPGHRRAQYENIAKDHKGTENGAPISDENEVAISTSHAAAMTGIKRVPILANFEEWMKMATDNKINAANSWNFALIDYFHDMSLLKEGDGVNFQKASCTLDGCVKIYTSRVDSVATETGKLLSGLADSGNKDRNSASEEGEDDGNEEGEGETKRKAKKKARSSEATLATSFSQLQLKKFELEFSVDPLFKKASADFDEGGAKGLLLNHLCIDSNGRIIFDSSDDTEEHKADASENTVTESYEPAHTENTFPISQHLSEDENLDIELDDLKSNFLPDLSVLDSQDVCPSLKTLEIGETMDLASLPLLQDHKKGDDLEDHRDSEADEAGLLGLGGSGDDIDMAPEPDFGAGGEAWAHEAGLEPLIGAGVHLSGHGANQDEFEGDDEFESKAGSFDVKMQFGSKESKHPDIFGYFDHTMKSNWAGPEHWRIRKMKRDIAPRDGLRRKEKEPFEINFQSSLAQKLTEQVYTSASSNSVISLPKSQWRSRTRHLLPDDKHFNSTHLLRLFLKPKARLGRRGGRRRTKDPASDHYEARHLDDTFWAQKQDSSEFTNKGDYDAEFFREDDGAFPLGMLEEDADEFSDARERFSPAFGQEEQTTTMSIIGTDINGDVETGYGTSLVTKSRRLRPDYVSYAKVAKKVDVRLLKEKMWKGIGFDEQLVKTQEAEAINEVREPVEEQLLNFTSIMNNLQHVYAPEAMAEISTSYCFISLLHLANEKGLVLSSSEGLEDLSIRRDTSAEISAAA